MTTKVEIFATADEVAIVGADRVLSLVAQAQVRYGEARVALTGGTMGSAVLAAIRHAPGIESVNWSAVSLWWGDERFLPSGDADRNETQNREALLDHLDIPAANIHPILGPDAAENPQSSADAYEHLLQPLAAGGNRALFDVVMLGVGPDAHVASLFPGHPEVLVTDRLVVPVTDSPKPPPERVSLTLPCLCNTDHMLISVTGSDKADAVSAALSSDDPAQVPASAVRGRSSTSWLLDEGAATHLR